MKLHSEQTCAERFSDRLRSKFICSTHGKLHNATMIFEKTGTSIDPYISSIVLALALIVGALLTTYLADILGRKILNIVSLSGSAVGLFTLAIYYYFHIKGYDLTSFALVPVLSLSFVVLISSAGINALAYVCGIEYLPQKVCEILKRRFNKFSFIFL